MKFYRLNEIPVQRDDHVFKVSPLSKSMAVLVFLGIALASLKLGLHGGFHPGKHGIDLPAALADLRHKAAAAGRDPDSLSISVFAFEGAQGDTLKRYRDLGVERVTLVAPRRMADALPFLDYMATFIPHI